MVLPIMAEAPDCDLGQFYSTSIADALAKSDNRLQLLSLEPLHSRCGIDGFEEVAGHPDV
jgi:hypothetical protein